MIPLYCYFHNMSCNKAFRDQNWKYFTSNTFENDNCYFLYKNELKIRILISCTFYALCFLFKRKTSLCFCNEHCASLIKTNIY